MSFSPSCAQSPTHTQGGSVSPCSTCSFIEDRRHSLGSISSLSSLSDISPLPSPDPKTRAEAEAPASGRGVLSIPLNALGLSENDPTLSESELLGREEDRLAETQEQELVYPYPPSSVSSDPPASEHASTDSSSPSSSHPLPPFPRTHRHSHSGYLSLPHLAPPTQPLRENLYLSTSLSDADSKAMQVDCPPVDPLEKGMRSLPAELVSQIFEDTLNSPSKSLCLSLMLTSKDTYRRVVPTLYHEVVLSKHNVKRYFYGLGVDTGGSTSTSSSLPEYSRPDVWPVSGPGLAPLHTMGLSYDPSHAKATPFIRKFTLCNLVESLTVSDLASVLYLLRAASRTYVDGMDTWTSRVLFDQIDKITIGEEVFSELDDNLLGMRGLLGEIWNVIKGDAVHLHFPSHKKLKRETYMTAVNALGAPSSIGQRDRLLGELVIRTPTLDGVGLDQTAASLVRIYLEPMSSSHPSTTTTARCEECEALAQANADASTSADGIASASAGGNGNGNGNENAEGVERGEVSGDQGVQVKEFIRRTFWPSTPSPIPVAAPSMVQAYASNQSALANSP
ncbi:hypothetical protein IAU59_005469 [Kwoniella sp. CBS 9459]